MVLLVTSVKESILIFSWEWETFGGKPQWLCKQSQGACAIVGEMCAPSCSGRWSLFTVNNLTCCTMPYVYKFLGGGGRWAWLLGLLVVTTAGIPALFSIARLNSSIWLLSIQREEVSRQQGEEAPGQGPDGHSRELHGHSRDTQSSLCLLRVPWRFLLAVHTEASSPVVSYSVASKLFFSTAKNNEQAQF